jgi:hypothetical protein
VVVRTEKEILNKCIIVMANLKLNIKCHIFYPFFSHNFAKENLFIIPFGGFLIEIS